MSETGPETQTQTFHFWKIQITKITEAWILCVLCLKLSQWIGPIMADTWLNDELSIWHWSCGPTNRFLPVININTDTENQSWETLRLYCSSCSSYVFVFRLCIGRVLETSHLHITQSLYQGENTHRRRNSSSCVWSHIQPLQMKEKNQSAGLKAAMGRGWAFWGGIGKWGSLNASWVKSTLNSICLNGVIVHHLRFELTTFHSESWPRWATCRWASLVM